MNVCPYNWLVEDRPSGEALYSGLRPQRDVNHFLNHGQRLGLYVIARPGPVMADGLHAEGAGKPDRQPGPHEYSPSMTLQAGARQRVSERRT